MLVDVRVGAEVLVDVRVGADVGTGFKVAVRVTVSGIFVLVTVGVSVLVALGVGVLVGFSVAVGEARVAVAVVSAAAGAPSTDPSATVCSGTAKLMIQMNARKNSHAPRERMRAAEVGCCG